MCTDEDDEVFECEDSSNTDSSRRTNSAASMNTQAAGQEKVPLDDINNDSLCDDKDLLN